MLKATISIRISIRMNINIRIIYYLSLRCIVTIIQGSK